MRIAITLTLAFLTSSIFGQINTIYLSNNEAASQWKGNPAFHGREKVSVYSVPVFGSFDLSVANTAFSYGDLINGNTVQISNIVDGLEDDNHLLVQNRLTVAALGLRVGKNQFRMGMDMVNDVRFSYSGDFAELLWKGNGHEDVIGRNMNMSGLGINMMSYYDFFIGYSRRMMGDKLFVGGNLHYLQGLETIYTQNSEFSLMTDADDYALTASGALDIRTSLPPDSIGINEGRYVPLRGPKNTGVSVDLGAQYRHTDRLTFQIAAMNLGAINWGSESRSFVLDGVSVTYEGLDLEDLYDDDEDTEAALEAAVDSIADKFELEERVGSFSTPTNSRFLIGADYQIGKKNHVQLTYAHMRNFGRGFNSVVGMFRRDFSRLLSVQSGVQFFNFQSVLLPVSFQFNPGPVQFAVGTNNILAPISYKTAKYASVHLSLSFRFGKDDRLPRYETVKE